LAQPGSSYIAYAPELSGEIGLKGMRSGTYKLQWFDCATGKGVLQSQTVAAGDQTWSKPAGIGDEVAVYIRRLEE
jgi:hypothetical protein